MQPHYSLESIFQLGLALKRQMHSQIEALELDIAPMHMRVIKIISTKPACTAMDIATLLKRDKAQVTRLLKTLIEQDLISKVPHPEDKRSQILVATQKGEAGLAMMKKIDMKVVNALTQGISDQELAQFDAVAKKIVANLSGEID
jgi:DNA-binding MarR family transcriptional regulator